MFFWRGSSNQLQSTPSCGKTCLLFQFVFNVALHSNNNVIFICYRLRLDSKPPFLSQSKRVLQGFSCQILILTRETPQGFTSSIRNGYKPLLLLKRGTYLDHL
eukprot:XP_025980328.1 uncharacterized protein LOC112998521 [Glycine max]